jgi:hypothetical protein
MTKLDSENTNMSLRVPRRLWLAAKAACAATSGRPLATVIREDVINLLKRIVTNYKKANPETTVADDQNPTA